MYVWSPNMWSVFMSYMTLMVPISYMEKVSYGPPIYVWSPHMYNMISMTPMVPHTLYWIGIWWSTLPYMEEASYGPPIYVWSPHMWSVFMSYMTLMVPNSLHGKGIIWSPHMYVWSPDMYNMMSMTLLVPPYLILNRYLMVPSLPYMEQVSYSPPNVWYVFSGQLRKRSTACPNKAQDADACKILSF